MQNEASVTQTEFEHITWVRLTCEIFAPDRAVEMIERGLSRTQVFDEMHIAIHGVPRLAATAPFRTLFTGDWPLNDPELDWVTL